MFYGFVFMLEKVEPTYVLKYYFDLVFSSERESTHKYNISKKFIRCQCIFVFAL